MKSPFTGGNAILCSEKRKTTFRKEQYEYVHQYYKCIDTNEYFTTTELDNVNVMQVYNQYRVKYGIPFADEIKNIRSLYGLSATKMASILGFGDNMYRLYENGEIPNVANGKTLKAILSPSVFKKYIENAKDSLKESEYSEILSKIKDLCNLQYSNDTFIKNILFENSRGEYNGFAPQSISRLKNVILFFIEKFGGVFQTFINKLLFYTDFVAYRDNGQSITGLSYRAIQFGPVPTKWQMVYGGAIEDIDSEEVSFKNGNIGIKLISKIQYDKNSLTKEEIRILEKVYNTFKNDTSISISEKSHKEEAWIMNQEKHNIINFNYAFNLKAI